MTTEHDKEDAQWLQALAGESDPTADALINQQAAALRRALQARKAALDAKVPLADEAQYQQLLFRLRREGLTKPPSVWQSAAQWGKAATLAMENPALWGMVATVTLVVGVVIQMGVFHPAEDDANVMRGGGQAAHLMVPDPEARLAELLVGLKAAGAEPIVNREAGGRIAVIVKSSDSVLDYLSTQRIEPVIVNGEITLFIEAKK